MKFLKKDTVNKSMKVLGSLALFLGSIVTIPTSLLTTHQPKCPDDLLK